MPVDLAEKIKQKTAVIGVAGMGYVGIPLAFAFGRAGFRVIGFDVDAEKVAGINRGLTPVADIDAAAFAALVQEARLEATTDQSRLGEVDAVCVCVPTPLTEDRQPDISYVTSEAEEIASYLHAGQLVILESTTYPGTTRDEVLPILEGSGLKAGADFYLAYSPERVDPGNKKYGIKNTPKLVGGLDVRSTELAALLYRQVADEVLPLSCPEAAEMAKVFENVFRNINIALVNELAQLCERMDISVWEVIRAAASKPFGYMTFYPGPGTGGHCIPLDPHYLASRARDYGFETRFIQLAADINEGMPAHIVARLEAALAERGRSLKGAAVLVLGAAYKKDIGDMRESPSLKLLELLLARGADVSYNDPFVPRLKVGGASLDSVELNGARLAAADCVVIATDHSRYDLAEIAAGAKLLFDARGVTSGLAGGNIMRLGEGWPGT